MPTLLFLHFAGGSADAWARLISHLPAEQPTAAIDFRGWAFSSGPPDPAGYSITALADDVEAVIAHLGLTNVILVGLSMGGKVAMTLAGRQGARREDDGKGPLSGAVLLGPASPLPMQLSSQMMAEQGAAYKVDKVARFVARNVLTWPGGGADLGDAVYEEIAAGLLRNNGVANEAWPAVGMRGDVEQVARHIAIPVLLVAGEKDAVEPREKMENEVLPVLKGAKFEVLEDTGHLMMYQKPRELARVITQFLESLS
jgi:pimeloyl-ACP methyl ester carboxylesterase